MPKNTQTEFKIGEHVVYPLQGVGTIKDVKERVVNGKSVTFYVIYIDISDLTVSIPVEKTGSVGLRGLVSAQEARKALNSISSKYEPVNVDWKTRYQMNVDLVKEGSICSISKVVQGLYHRSKVKELPVQERKLYDNALRLLIDECAFSLEKDPDEIEKEIFTRLEK
ncbi:MAG: CarD family transcriptional regulator [Sphaerochaetaceae bacterium]|nr:CarD family transcriptional regulator [Sphaerochaetaceae bacterium]